MKDMRLKQALVDAHCIPGWDFFITATLPPAASRITMEDVLYAWVARINRFYLGGQWTRLGSAKMQGVVFFEKLPDHHAHLIVRPPSRAIPFHFQMSAADWFYPAGFNKFARPVTRKGDMEVRLLATERDQKHAVSYTAKELEYRFNEGDWKYLDQLSARQQA